jgi:hypothetical protein
MKDERGRQDAWILLPIVVGGAGLGLAVAEILLRTIWTELPRGYPYGFGAALAFVPAWMLTGLCFKQKHTYDAEIYRKRPWAIVFGWTFFLSIMLLLVGFLFGTPAWAILKGTMSAGRSVAVGSGRERLWAAAFLFLSLPSVLIGVSAISRGLLLWSIQRHVEQLATSTARSAAPGLVELRGVARPPGAESGFICGQIPPDRDHPAAPFELEDETGRIRVEPPPVSLEDDPRFSAKRHPHYGLPVLEGGDEVVVVGAVSEDPERPGQRRVTPWKASGLPFGTGLLSRPEIFFLACGDEEFAMRRLLRARLGWLTLGSLLTAGSLILCAASAGILASSPLLRSLAVFTR